jgi:hypothetical protein
MNSSWIRFLLFRSVWIRISNLYQYNILLFFIIMVTLTWLSILTWWFCDYSVVDPRLDLRNLGIFIFLVNPKFFIFVGFFFDSLPRHWFWLEVKLEKADDAVLLAFVIVHSWDEGEPLYWQGGCGLVYLLTQLLAATHGKLVN